MEPRYKTNFAGRLRLLTPFQADCVAVTVRDMSSRGLQVESPQELFVGALVQVRAQRLITLGEVRYCHRSTTGVGFCAGIEADVIHVCPECYPGDEKESVLH